MSSTFVQYESNKDSEDMDANIKNHSVMPSMTFPFKKDSFRQTDESFDSIRSGDSVLPDVNESLTPKLEAVTPSNDDFIRELQEKMQQIKKNHLNQSNGGNDMSLNFEEE